MWDKESIHNLLDTNPKAVSRAILAVYNLQTYDEQSGSYTRHTNGVGFSKFDAEFMTSLAQQIKAGRSLSTKQFVVGRNKIKRYWRQLVEIANAKAVESVTGDSATLTAQNGTAGSYLGTTARVATGKASWCDCENYDGEMKCPECQIRAGVPDDVAYGNAAGFLEKKDEMQRMLKASW